MMQACIPYLVVLHGKPVDRTLASSSREASKREESSGSTVPVLAPGYEALLLVPIRGQGHSSRLWSCFHFHFAYSTLSTQIPSVWGPVSKAEDPFAMPSQGCQCVVM